VYHRSFLHIPCTQVSFAKEPSKKDYILQKRPIVPVVHRTKLLFSSEDSSSCTQGSSSLVREQDTLVSCSLRLLFSRERATREEEPERRCENRLSRENRSPLVREPRENRLLFSRDSLFSHKSV